MHISNISLTKRILICAALSLLPASWLAYGRITGGVAAYQSAVRLVSVSAELTTVGDVIHAVQKERGETAGMLATSSHTTSEGTENARYFTNQVLHSLEALSSASGAIPIDRLSASVNTLRELRQRIDRREVSSAQSIVQYSELVDRFLSLSRELGERGARSEIADEIQAYNLFSQIKELAGRERATANGSIKAGVAERAALLQLSALYGSQSALLQKFSASGSTLAQEAELVGVTADGPLREMRERLLLAGLNGDLSRLDASTWYRLATARIDAMRALEQKLSAKFPVMPQQQRQNNGAL